MAIKLSVSTCEKFRKPLTCRRNRGR